MKPGGFFSYQLFYISFLLLYNNLYMLFNL